MIRVTSAEILMIAKNFQTGIVSFVSLSADLCGLFSMTVLHFLCIFTSKLTGY